MGLDGDPPNAGQQIQGGQHMAALCKCQRATVSLSSTQRGYGSVAALPLGDSVCMAVGGSQDGVRSQEGKTWVSLTTYSHLVIKGWSLGMSSLA